MRPIRSALLAACTMLGPLLGPAAADAATINITESYTAIDNTGPGLVTLGGTVYQAFRFFIDGSGPLTFSGFSSYNGPGTVAFSHYTTTAAGWGFQDVGPDTGAYYTLSAGGESINVSAVLNLLINQVTGNSTGVGYLTILDTSGGPLWQELMAGSGGVITVAINAVNLNAMEGQYATDTVAQFTLTGVANLPAPGGIALFGLPMLGLLGLSRVATRRD